MININKFVLNELESTGKPLGISAFTSSWKPKDHLIILKNFEKMGITPVNEYIPTTKLTEIDTARLTEIEILSNSFSNVLPPEMNGIIDGNLELEEWERDETVLRQYGVVKPRRVSNVDLSAVTSTTPEQKETHGIYINNYYIINSNFILINNLFLF
jgi:hypothetical protein